jgi:uncharacterized membrane protein
MASHVKTISIDAPPATVWALMSDIESWPSWTKSVDTAERLEAGPLQVGSTAAIKQPKLAKTKWEVTELEPGRSFTWTSRSPGVRSTGIHTVDPAASGGGSDVTLTLVLSGPFAWMIELLAGRLVERYVGWEAEGLKARAEADAAS